MCVRERVRVFMCVCVYVCVCSLWVCECVRVFACVPGVLHLYEKKRANISSISSGKIMIGIFYVSFHEAINAVKPDAVVTSLPNLNHSRPKSTKMYVYEHVYMYKYMCIYMNMLVRGSFQNCGPQIYSLASFSSSSRIFNGFMLALTTFLQGGTISFDACNRPRWH